MANRISGYSKSKKIRKINSFFLPCELKPNNKLFKALLSDYTYDITPAYVFATMGITAYDNPNNYSIIRLGGSTPLFGYLVTITNPDGILILDKLKGFIGANTINYNIRWIAPVYTSPSEFIDSWVYVISDYILEKFETIEVVKEGIWDLTDEVLFTYSEKISK